MPKPYPQEFREDAVRVTPNREPGVTLEQVAADLEVHPASLTRWLRCRRPRAAQPARAAAIGVRGISAKTADAVAPAKLYRTADLARALGTAATVGRFAEGDPLLISDHQASTTVSNRSAAARPPACSRERPARWGSGST